MNTSRAGKEKSKYLVVERFSGSKETGQQLGYNYNDCKILIETDDLAEAYRAAAKVGYMSTEHNFGGVRIFKEIKPAVQEVSHVQ